MTQTNMSGDNLGLIPVRSNGNPGIRIDTVQHFHISHLLPARDEKKTSIGRTKTSNLNQPSIQSLLCKLLDPNPNLKECLLSNGKGSTPVKIVLLNKKRFNRRSKVLKPTDSTGRVKFLSQPVLNQVESTSVGSTL